jgi:hypothetical protein
MPMQAFAPMPPFGAPGGYGGYAPQGHAQAPVKLPWVAIVCYGFSILSAGGIYVGLVLFIVGLASGDKKSAAAGGTIALASSGGLVVSLFLVWAGKVVSLLNEIAIASRRR